MNDGELELLRQRVDELDGSRQMAATGRAAVLINDLSGLLALPETLKSAKAAGSTPTKAEFDALVEDVTTLHLRLRALVTALRGRLGR